MEAMFTTLAWYCYSRPLPLPRYINVGLNTAKSGFIVVFTVWHTIACACAWYIGAESFSMEWAARPEEPTDSVSTVTSGIVDYLVYFPRSRATGTFKAAFFAFIGLMALRATGSSTITATDGIETVDPLPIGRIATSSITPNTINLGDSIFASRLAQTYMVVRLEQLLGAPWGYVPESNWLIPLPAEQLNMASTLEYETDLVRFHYTCRWHAPTTDTVFDSTLIIGDERWTGNFVANATASMRGHRHGPGIIPLRPSNSSSESSGVSAYLFLGGNTTIPLNTSNSNIAWLDLSGLPTMYNRDMFASSIPASPVNVLAPLAAVLICDPHLQFTSGKVVLDVQTNITIPDVTVQSTNLARSPGNIDSSAARTLFTYALFSAISAADPGFISTGESFGEDPTDYINFNSVALKMLLQPPPSLHNWSSMGSLRPLDLATINKQIDSYTLSALKVFTSGLTGDGDTLEAEFFTTVVNAQYTVVRLALVSTNVFAALHSALFCTILLLLAGLAYLNGTGGRDPFNLENIRKKREREKES